MRNAVGSRASGCLVFGDGAAAGLDRGDLLGEGQRDGRAERAGAGRAGRQQGDEAGARFLVAGRIPRRSRRKIAFLAARFARALDGGDADSLESF